MFAVCGERVGEDGDAAAEVGVLVRECGRGEGRGRGRGSEPIGAEEHVALVEGVDV